MRTLLRSDEFTCPSCVGKIEAALHALDGVDTAKVHFTTGRIEVDHDPGRIAPERLRETVQDVGYEAQISAF